MLTDVSRALRFISMVWVPICSPLRVIAKRIVSVAARAPALAPSTSRSAPTIPTAHLMAAPTRAFAEYLTLNRILRRCLFGGGKFGLLWAARNERATPPKVGQ